MSEILALIVPFAAPIAIAVVVIILLCLMIKVVKGNEALVVSGMFATRGGNPKIKVAGGAIVIPFIQTYKKFDLCVRTASRENDLTKTRTGVPIVIDWAISYSPDTSSEETLHAAVRQFLDKDPSAMEEIIMNVISGGVRAVISTMTPTEVMVGKDTLDDSVQKNIEAQMKQLGFKVILTIQEVRDPEGSTYFKDVAAEDRETTRRKAAIFEAENDKERREKAAEADRAAQTAELNAQVEVAKVQKDTDVQRAQYQAETAREQKKAERAGELQEQEVLRDLATRKGMVAVEEQNQADAAAQAEQKVKVTRAETDKKERTIAAQAEADVKKTQAAGDAEAAKVRAEGEAEASATRVTKEAEAQANATERKALAEAKATEVQGQADAKAIEAKGLAEAKAIEAKGLAEAKAAREMSEAQAANDKVNFQIQMAEIVAKMRVEIASEQTKAMAEVGKNAKFYDFGGGAKLPGDKTDLLSRVLGNIPLLMAQANAESEATNGKPATDVLGDLTQALFGPLVGALGGEKSTTPATSTASTDASIAPVTDNAEPSQSGPTIDQEDGEVSDPVLPAASESEGGDDDASAFVP